MDKVIPGWAQLVALGVALLTWMELRLVPRSECQMKHADTQRKLAEHEASTDGAEEKLEALADKVTEVDKKAAQMKTDVQWLKAAVSSIAKKVGANGFPHGGHEEED